MTIVKDGDVCVPQKRSQTTETPVITTRGATTTTATVSFIVTRIYWWLHSLSVTEYPRITIYSS